VRCEAERGVDAQRHGVGEDRSRRQLRCQFRGSVRGERLEVLDLPDDEARPWLDLLDSGRLRELSSVDTSAPDRFVYRVSGPGLDITAAEQQLPDDVRGLFDQTLRPR